MTTRLLFFWMLLSSFIATAGTLRTPQANDKALTDASAFLARATFGPSIEEIQALAATGDYAGWIDHQFSLPPSSHYSWISTRLPGIAWTEMPDVVETAWRDSWWEIAVNGEDQLRQRVAFALSEIFVVSMYGPLITKLDGLTVYYDTLADHAFGNFRDLLGAVSRSPMMGEYLSYLGNAKANPAQGNHPDENYARELMQLFSIGLYQLNHDGSLKTDTNGDPVPTYNQHDIQELARVFTGWTDDNGGFFPGEGEITHHARISPMVTEAEYHDTGKKQLSGVLGVDVPAGLTAEEDLDFVLDRLFLHPNVAPFIARRLIQRLVTSNPSPAYIARVASAFDDNGNGVRGDMKAVIRAILLDPEALAGGEGNPESFGKVREPLLFITHLWRAFHAADGLHKHGRQDEYEYRCFNFLYVRSFLQQNAPLEPLTVFNWFTPDDAPSELASAGLVAPEMTIMGIDGLHHLMMSLVHETYTYEVHDMSAHLDVSQERSWLQNGRPDLLLDRLDLVLMAGSMTAEMRQLLLAYINDHGSTPPDTLARNLISLVVTSSEYAVQR
ncbi:DUF1800 domain-containing protein [Thiolapillus sp.]